MNFFLAAKCICYQECQFACGAVVCGSLDGALDNRGTGINRENKHLMDL